jgi:beta-glucosidase/6-phospho-beta-glucosidase/beta-galactosidase
MTLEEFNRWFDTNLTLKDSGCLEWIGCKLSSGYGIVRMNRKNIRAHRIALERKLGREIVSGMLACHSCNNPCCCNPEHLREGTLQDNMNDKVLANRQTKGETNGNSKLTAEQVIEIRTRKQNEYITNQQLANIYGVKKACIAKILRREKWAHV